ncbi:uncharacterized protein LOC112591993 [Melanaphis sacchari]|uniref:uncharacterized protein LOC112591993 n=1 Tax=Melanaphis sacchari TaxID=742174 RepID=UPI000DC13494|nr:uncharacterized protein LOC112591993 [Melanaphis sacchari]
MFDASIVFYVLNEEDILFVLEITDAMAFDSDIGGDSDAEDTIPALHWSSNLSLEGIEAFQPNSDTETLSINSNRETISINSNTVTGQTRSLRSQKRSLHFENTKLDSKNASTSAGKLIFLIVSNILYNY